MHELTKNAAGQSVPQGSHGHMTAANAMKHTNAKQTLIHGQGTGQCLQERHWPDYLLVTTLYIHHVNYNKTLQNTSNAQQTLTDGQNTNTAYKNATDQISS